ncbi:hypothetical protein MMC12_005314, partial [Toensbergia leucococca]|nr:hypothetical protein [Toensbergia leucococca]
MPSFARVLRHHSSAIERIFARLRSLRQLYRSRLSKYELRDLEAKGDGVFAFHSDADSERRSEDRRRETTLPPLRSRLGRLETLMSYVNRGSIKSTEHHTTVIATDGINMCEAGRQTELRDSASTGEEVGIAQ